MELQAQLHHTESLPESEREFADELYQEIERLLARPRNAPPLPREPILGRLTDGAKRFEVTHPELTALIGKLCIVPESCRLFSVPCALQKRPAKEGVNELESSVSSPLLASPQGGVAASSKKFRAATDMTQPGWFSFGYQSENHPGLASSGSCAIFF
jgi:uncharacterized protein DUF4404